MFPNGNTLAKNVAFRILSSRAGLKLGEGGLTILHAKSAGSIV